VGLEGGIITPALELSLDLRLALSEGDTDRSGLDGRVVSARTDCGATTGAALRGVRGGSSVVVGADAFAVSDGRRIIVSVSTARRCHLRLRVNWHQNRSDDAGECWVMLSRNDSPCPVHRAVPHFPTCCRRIPTHLHPLPMVSSRTRGHPADSRHPCPRSSRSASAPQHSRSRSCSVHPCCPR